jgi:hypothetical protein
MRRIEQYEKRRPLRSCRRLAIVQDGGRARADEQE